eukprot:1154237-Pelagomonas_calceolata.AAC.9
MQLFSTHGSVAAASSSHKRAASVSPVAGCRPSSLRPASLEVRVSRHHAVNRMALCQVGLVQGEHAPHMLASPACLPCTACVQAAAADAAPTSSNGASSPQVDNSPLELSALTAVSPLDGTRNSCTAEHLEEQPTPVLQCCSQAVWSGHCGPTQDLQRVWSHPLQGHRGVQVAANAVTDPRGVPPYI